MNKKAVVLSSGGLDSTTCLAVVVDKYGAENVTSISVKYGQKHLQELYYASRIADVYGVDHYVLDLSSIFKASDSSLLGHSNKDVPEGSYVDQQRESETGIVSTYVPFRNGAMLSAVTAYSMSLYPDYNIDIYLANHADDAAGNAYPDCSETFSIFMSDAIFEGTGHQVRLHTPFAGLHKADIVKKGLELNVPYQLTWSCYKGENKACGVCGTCIDRIEAFKKNGVIDPIEYSNLIEDPFKELR